MNRIQSAAYAMFVRTKHMMGDNNKVKRCLNKAGNHDRCTMASSIQEDDEHTKIDTHERIITIT